MLKCDSGIVRVDSCSLHAVQYMRHPDSVVMFCSYYFKNGQHRHFAVMLSMPDFVLSFVLNIFFQNQGFCFHKIASIKIEYIYIMSKDNCFPSFSVLENPFHLRSEWRENDLILYTKKQISLDKLLPIRNGPRNPLNSKIELFMATVSD